MQGEAHRLGEIGGMGELAELAERHRKDEQDEEVRPSPWSAYSNVLTAIQWEDVTPRRRRLPHLPRIPHIPRILIVRQATMHKTAFKSTFNTRYRTI